MAAHGHPPRSRSGSIRNGSNATFFLAGLDHHISMGLSCVFLLYLLVTVGTFTKLPTPVSVIDEANSGHSVVRRAKVLLHGKLEEAATTADALKELIAQQEAKFPAKDSAYSDHKQEQHPIGGNAQEAIEQRQKQLLAAKAAALGQKRQVEREPKGQTSNAIQAAQTKVVAPQAMVQQQLQMARNANEKVIAEIQTKAPDPKLIQQEQHHFPIMANEDVEDIDHPGIKYADLSKFNGPVPNAKLTVPKFWNPPAYGGDVRKYLGNYGERLITMEEAKSIGSFDEDGHETIYITIASYRDPECPLTIESIFQRAKFPKRIKIVVVDQYIDGTDDKCIEPKIPCEQDPSQVLCEYANQLESVYMDARLGIGPVFARHLGFRAYRGEYFAMQIDAHVRFVEHWDDSIVEQWKSANNEMTVMTTYLSDLNNSIDPVTNKAIRPGRPIMCATDYEGSGKYKHLRHGQQPEGPAMIHGEPTLHPFFAAGFSFARGHFAAQGMLALKLFLF